MKTIISFIISLAATQAFAAETLKVEGNLKWTGYKVKNIGDSHTGDLKLKSGKMDMNGENIVGGEFVIDMNSLTNEDKKLEKHLKSDDFFGVSKFQEATYKITSAEKLAKPGPNGETHKIKGNLTIRGKTNPIDIMATIKSDKNTWVANAKTTIPDRSKFDIKYNSPAIFGLAKLANKAIADEIKVDLSLKATK